MEDNNQPPFIAYLCSLKQRENRGALAALRRGLGQQPGSVPDMFRYVVPFIPRNAGSWEETTYYIIASLYGYHSESTGSGNMGDHFAQLRNEASEDAVERRFQILLAAHHEDLDDHLRQAISQLRSKDIPVNWSQLMRDIRYWNHPDARTRVIKRWANAFWRTEK